MRPTRKRRQVLGLLESLVTGHKFCWFRERTADKLEVIRFDPYGSVGSRREIHNYVKPMLLSLRTRKNRELFFNPNKKPTPRSSFTDWNYNAELFAFRSRLNEDINDALLRQAFTERSYVIKEKARQQDVGLNTESLEMLDNEFMADEGRAILETYIKSVLRYEFPLLPDAGIQAICDFLVSDAVLAHISSHIGTKDLILCEEYPPPETTLSHIFQALVSAVEKSGGPKRTKLFIQDFVMTYLFDKNVNEIWDIPKPWKMLTEIMTEKGEVIEPRLIRESGRNTILSVFVVGIYTGTKKLIGTGIGETVEIAQEMAARDTLSGIFGTREPTPFKFLAERANPKPFIPQVAEKSHQKQRV